MGAVIFGEALSLLQLCRVALVLAGIVLLKFASA
jgi:multidrug transporter EmrE-like cation transporter